jgi:hypothetical protein
MAKNICSSDKGLYRQPIFVKLVLWPEPVDEFFNLTAKIPDRTGPER